MFGISRTERGAKKLKSALGILLPGDKAAQQAIMDRSPDDTAAAARDVASGTDPYKAAALLIALDVRRRILTLPVDDRQRLLRALSGAHTGTPPRTLKFAAHMCMVLARLEGGGKPLIPIGTTAAYLQSIAEAFTDQKDTKNAVASHLYTFAAKMLEGEDESD